MTLSDSQLYSRLCRTSEIGTRPTGPLLTMSVHCGEAEVAERGV